MSRGYDLLEARTGDTVYVLGGTSTLARLAKVSGLTVTGRVPAAPVGPIPKAPASQDSILPKLLQGKKYPTFYGGYRTTKAYDQFESDLQTQYPDLVKKIQFGKSFTGKHPLNVVCVTEDAKNGCKLNPNTDKPRFLLESQIHAREIATSEMSWRLLTTLVDGDGKDAADHGPAQEQRDLGGAAGQPGRHRRSPRTGSRRTGRGSDSSAWQRKNDDEDQTPTGGCPPPWVSSQPGVDMNRNWSVA